MWGLVAALLLAAGILPIGGQVESDLAACEALGQQGGSLEQVTDCLSDVGDDRAQRPAAIARIEALRLQYPGDPWPTYRLAYLKWFDDAGRSAELYVIAAGEFASSERNDLAVTSLLNAARMLGNSAEYDRAMELIDRASALAVRSSDPSSDVKVEVDRAHVLYLRGRELARAYRMLLEIESRVRSISPVESTNWLDSAAKVTYDLGLMNQSLAYRRQLIDELGAAGDTWSMALAKYGFAITYRVLYESTLSIRTEYRELLADALETAERSENDTVAILAGLELGKVVAGAEGRTHLETCLERATEQRYERGIILCSRALAGLLRETDLSAATRLLNASMDRAAAGEDLQARIFGAAERLMIRWQALPRQNAIDDALAALDLIETYRRLQSSASGRTGVFSLWASTYLRVAGLVLGGAEASAAPPTAEEIGLAFEIVERMRARTLIDDLEREQSIPSLTDAAGSIEYAAALRAIVDAQSALLDPDLEASIRVRNTDDLRRAEAREAALREQLANDDPRLDAWMPDFARVDEVRRELAPDEAMLSFHVSLWENVYGDFGGGAWLAAITRDGARTYRLPDRTTLDAVVPAFAGLVSRRDGTWQSRAAPLYEALLGEALQDLPSGIDKLIIIPDGPLHRLPFGVLAPRDKEPLAARYALSLAPSATLWLRWRTVVGPLDPSASDALVLADPALAGNSRTDVVARVGGGAGSPNRLGALPYARVEGRAIADHLGSRATIAMAEAATEDLLKDDELARYAIIHLAAHAVLDEELPERSAVYLASGSTDQDGLLQSREIVGLPLRGKTVVLSGCQSAAGAVLQGEGVMSLARSFFQAGATTVVGSLWPLRDDDAAALFDDFYRHLAGGQSIATAMRAAQDDRRTAGAPAAGWAGVVVLGDGSAVPFPGGIPASGGTGRLALAFLAAAALAVATYAALRRRAV